VRNAQAEHLVAWINPPNDEQTALQRVADQHALILPLSLDESFASPDLISSEPLALPN
jgi:hypothetical protein